MGSAMPSPKALPSSFSTGSPWVPTPGRYFPVNAGGPATTVSKDPLPAGPATPPRLSKILAMLVG